MLLCRLTLEFSSLRKGYEADTRETNDAFESPMQRIVRRHLRDPRGWSLDSLRSLEKASRLV